MDPINPSRPVVTPYNSNGNPGTPVPETAQPETPQIGEHSLSAVVPEGHDSLMNLIARLKASILEEVQHLPPEPPPLKSRLISIAKSRKPSSSFFNAIKFVGKKTINLGSKIFHFLIWRCINPVRDSSIEAGGKVTFRFSQSKGKWLENMVWDSSTRKGVCWALSLNWLKHRCQGTSLFHKIYDGHQKREINPEVFEEIRALQEAGKGSQPYYEAQWLPMHGMTLNEITYSDPGFHNDQHMPVDPEVEHPGNFPRKLAEAITAPEKSSSPLKMISIGGHNKGHAISAHIDPDNSAVTFFDPNFGEFQFPDSGAFNTWFSEHFWPKSKYGGSLVGMNQHFSVKHIAPSGENRERSI